MGAIRPHSSGYLRKECYRCHEFSFSNNWFCSYFFRVLNFTNMVKTSQILMVLASFVGLISTTTAFWFTSEEPKPTSSARVLYQSPPPDYYRPYVPQPLPYAIPQQVPWQAQLSPVSIQNVQLVPCLCPVNQEYSYDNPQDYPRKVQYGQPQQQPQQKRK